MRKLKLYVWEDVLTDYTSGVMFALAESEEEARVQLTMEQRDCTREKAVLLLDNARKNGNDRDRNLFCGCFLEDVLKEPRVLTEKCAFAVWGGG